MSVGVNLEFIYAGFDTREPIGEPAQIVIKIDVQPAAMTGGTHVYIPKIICDIGLRSTNVPDGSSSAVIGDMGSYETAEPVFLEPGKKGSTTCHIPMGELKIEKILAEVEEFKKIVSSQSGDFGIIKDQIMKDIIAHATRENEELIPLTRKLITEEQAEQLNKILTDKKVSKNTH